MKGLTATVLVHSLRFNVWVREKNCIKSNKKISILYQWWSYYKKFSRQFQYNKKK